MPVDTWPISVRTEGERTFIGIPERLGDGGSWRVDDQFPTLEEIAGEDWSEAVLDVLLPGDRTWAWWTRTDTYAKTGLPKARAGDDVNPAAVTEVLVHRQFWRGMTLALIPPSRPREQGLVRHWAASDTEQIPDHIWTAPDAIGGWDLEAIAAWCFDRDAWGDPRTIASQPAERIVTSFDGALFCGLSTDAAKVALHDVTALSERWRLRVIAGRPEDAWPGKVGRAS